MFIENWVRMAISMILIIICLSMFHKFDRIQWIQRQHQAPVFILAWLLQVHALPHENPLCSMYRPLFFMSGYVQLLRLQNSGGGGSIYVARGEGIEYGRGEGGRDKHGYSPLGEISKSCLSRYLILKVLKVMHYL